METHSLRGCLDLHTHSTCSDGTDSPAVLIQKAAAIGLSGVALTDHDTAKGIDEFMAAAEEYPTLTAIPGVEISSRYQTRELHILGLFIDPDNRTFKQFLLNARDERLLRAEAISIKLKALGYPVDLDAMLAGPQGDSIGRPHFATKLRDDYEFSSLGEVFDQLLRRGAPAYVPRHLPDPFAGIEAIHAAGGIASWAHPIYRAYRERSWARQVLKRLVPAGLDAVEGYYSAFTPSQSEIMTSLASEFGIGVSGGSDYHGTCHENIELGSGAGDLRVPGTLLEDLRRRHEQKKNLVTICVPGQPSSGVITP